MQSNPVMRALLPAQALPRLASSLLIGSILLQGPSAQAQSILTQGSEGEEVTSLQRRLVDLGCMTGSIDGLFGDQTQASVEQFQQANGISRDGIVGNETSLRLFGVNALPCLPLNRTPSPPVPATPSAPIAYSTDLVRRTQSDLQVAGYYAGDIDGIWGPETELAVTTFQNIQALPATGQIDNATLDRLNQLYGRPAQSSQAPLQVGATITNPSAAPPTATPLISYGDPNPISGQAAPPTPPTVATQPIPTAQIPTTQIPTGQIPTGQIPSVFVPNLSSPALPDGIPPAAPSPAVTRPLPTSQAQRRDRLSTPDQGYTVAIPAQTDISLASLQRLFPRAAIRNSKRGPYIFVEAYEQRDAADAIAKALAEQGIDARVVYRPE